MRYVKFGSMSCAMISFAIVLAGCLSTQKALVNRNALPSGDVKVNYSILHKLMPTQPGIGKILVKDVTAPSSMASEVILESVRYILHDGGFNITKSNDYQYVMHVSYYISNDTVQTFVEPVYGKVTYTDDVVIKLPTQKIDTTKSGKVVITQTQQDIKIPGTTTRGIIDRKLVSERYYDKNIRLVLFAANDTPVYRHTIQGDAYNTQYERRPHLCMQMSDASGTNQLSGATFYTACS